MDHYIIILIARYIWQMWDDSLGLLSVSAYIQIQPRVSILDLSSDICQTYTDPAQSHCTAAQWRCSQIFLACLLHTTVYLQQMSEWETPSQRNSPWHLHTVKCQTDVLHISRLKLYTVQDHALYRGMNRAVYFRFHWIIIYLTQTKQAQPVWLYHWSMRQHLTKPVVS